MSPVCAFTSHLLAAVLALCLFCPGVALADLAETTLSGTGEDPGNFVSAKLTLGWDGTNLTAWIENTSSDNSVITGFGLMGGTASLLAADFTASGTLDDSGWYAGNNLFMAPPGQFGTFDFGGDTGTPGLNAGDPNDGILAGTTATLEFLNLSSGVGSALDFLRTGNSNDLSVAMRLQTVGPDGEDSAKVGGFGGRLVPPIPAPGACLLGFVGLATVGWVKRKFV